MNFIQQTSSYEHEGKARRYQRTYYYRNDSGDALWYCDVFGSCISAPTLFQPQAPGLTPFTMTARGKLLNATYYLDDDSGRRIGTISRKGVGFRWKVLDTSEHEVYRVVDPASWKEAMLRDMLGGLPDGFAVIRDDHFVARISDEELVEGARTRPKNRLGKLLDKVFSSRAMTYRAEDSQQELPDPRTVVAVMTLLQVFDITGAASSG